MNFAVFLKQIYVHVNLKQIKIKYSVHRIYFNGKLLHRFDESIQILESSKKILLKYFFS